ncbi:hypothetical protein [uncultured Kordia sp.]|uniref:hypothetical protein n=1 Tax=uncultured Kordia sp. TaxID=507699 RepID=UPI002624ECB5|nr:hypothetical protein [uncultured Kordia sp.]
MYSKAISKLFLVCVLIGSLWSCSKAPKTIKTIEFSTDYKFNTQIQEKVEKDTVAWKYQISAADYATKGDYKNALQQWDLAMRGRDRNYSTSQIDSLQKLYTVVNAKEFIIAEAAKHQVVIINEAHHNSMHRMFTKSLLKDLYDQGYRYLALEALANGADLDADLNTRKYPIQKTGYYTKDPQFGNMIRTALSLGFQVVSYEATENVNGKEREIAQAKNLQELIENDPKGKFVIHCGFDHVLEGTHRSWEKAMAARLKEYTGIDPLTIHQVLYSEKGNSTYNHPMLKAFNVATSSVLIDKNKQPFKYTRRESWSDIAVFHPKTNYKNNRPNWLFTNGNQQITIDLQTVELDFPVMVLAYKKGEDIQTAVPVDIAEAKSKTSVCELGLKKGKYEIVVTNKTKTIMFEEIVE